MSGTSKYTPPPPAVERPPDPEQRATLVDEADWDARSGWAQMAKRAIKHGYRAKITYARGRFTPDGDRTHGLLLHIWNPGELSEQATAWWWAKATEGENTLTLRPEKKYAFKGATIKGRPWKITSSELTAWITSTEETT